MFDVIDKLGHVERIGVAGEQKSERLRPICTFIYCARGPDLLAVIFDRANHPDIVHNFCHH